MRPYLLDFLIEAHTAFGLLPTTLFLAINLLDRYCSRRVVYKRHYQLVGCAALLIAAKYDDKKDRVPTIKELKAMCCSLYDEDMFLQMEWHVLSTLDWVIGHPSVDYFLQVAQHDGAYDPELESMALYICEISLFHRDFVGKHSSDVARSALALARCILGRVQPRQGEWVSNYDARTLIALSQHLNNPSQVLSRKYSSAHASRAAVLLEQFLARQAAMARVSQAPPSPPRDSVIENANNLSCNYGSTTPQKPPYPAHLEHVGYMTPPITPENQLPGTQVQNQNYPTYGAFREPHTPTPPSTTPGMPSMQDHPYKLPVPPAMLQQYQMIGTGY